MLKKTFVITMLGSPFPWIQEFIDHVQHLGKYGWEWKIFTPADLKSKGNVEIVPMTADELSRLIELKLGVRPNLYITKSGVPSMHVTDLYIFSGVVFADWLTESDFWGITNLDVVYGRLDHFLPDSYLEKCDVFTDDIDVVNGVFSLWRNTPVVNNLFRSILGWENVINQPECVRCVTGKDAHTLAGSDEYLMTNVMRSPEIYTKLNYKFPPYYPLHSYDRLPQHRPEPNLEMHEDGTLIEVFEDEFRQRFSGNVLFEKPHWGREIMYFHFLTTKTWPKIRSY